MFLVLGLGVGWWLLAKYGVKNSTKVSIIRDKSIETTTSKLPTMLTTDRNGNKVSVVQLVGSVNSWDSEKGVLDFNVKDKRWQVNIDLSKAIMLVNSLVTIGDVVSVTDNMDKNWVNGFCPGDEVVLRLNESGVIFVINNGHRTCGNRDR